jgi:AcrR family transcriptional regulator
VTARTPLTLEAIVGAAMALLDSAGLEKFTTTTVARRLGVSQPALYSHITSLKQLQQEVATRGARELSRAVARAIAVNQRSPGEDPDAALFAMAGAYRRYVRRHPERYLLQLSAPRSQAYVEATERSAETVRGVLGAYGLDEMQVREAHIAFRAAVHGFVHLEARGALCAPPARASQHFDFFVRLFAAGLRSFSAEPPAARRDSERARPGSSRRA